MNDLDRYADVFRGLQPWSGHVPQGFYADWTGSLTDARFRAYQGMDPESVGGGPIEVRLPVIEDGEGWFEAVSQVEAAREARGRYVMITLGACYGAQAVNSWRVLQQLNPMPSTLVALEPEPVNLEWVAKHFRDNGIDPADHWLCGSAISDTNAPVFFPVGSPGSGAQNCVVTNEHRTRKAYVRRLTTSEARAKKALRSLLLDNSLGIERNLLTGEENDVDRDVLGSALQLARRTVSRVRRGLRSATAEHSQPVPVADFSFDADITLMSAVTLHDILGPFDRVDYLEVDIQQSEKVVFPPFMEDVKRKVRRVHIGTHGLSVHQALSDLFRSGGWEIVFDYPPNAQYQSLLGPFALNDGVLTVLNPTLSRA